VCFKYAVGAGTSALLGTGSSAWNAMSHVPLERRPIRRAAYRRLLRTATEPVPAESALQRHPLLGSRLARTFGLPRLVRAVHRISLVLGLIALGAAIRRRAEALRASPEGVD
jgi:hypothetical protein